MEIFNRHNSRNTGELPILTSWMLIGPRNTSAQSLSVQISEVPAGSEQPIHHHAPEQCYYIIKGKGLMIMEDETREVSAGDAVYIPSNKRHGIRNIGDDILEYLTANSPVFGRAYEDDHWPVDPL
jgi:mannose-6-phosphate isomerase-like protein (cupin superfamily)